MSGLPSATLVRALVTSTRPRQWVKNLLVTAAPLSGGVLLDAMVWPSVVGAFVTFVMASAAVYLFNDVRDLDSDRRHPLKSQRPIAAGRLPPVIAGTAAAVLACASTAVAVVIDGALGVTVVIYLVAQACYVVWFKHLAVIDLALVASGFLLRAIAGGVAAGIGLSQWFLLVASFGSLFMVAGKRYSEFMSVGSANGTRKSLEMYSESYLRFVWTLAAGVTITAYSLWAFEISAPSGVRWQALSIAPFVLAILRYAADVDRGVAGEPEDIVLRDRVLQTLGVVWLLLFVVGVVTTR